MGETAPEDVVLRTRMRHDLFVRRLAWPTLLLANATGAVVYVLLWIAYVVLLMTTANDGVAKTVVVSVLLFLLALLHALLLLRMLLASLWQRRLAFTFRGACCRRFKRCGSSAPHWMASVVLRWARSVYQAGVQTALGYELARRVTQRWPTHVVVAGLLLQLWLAPLVQLALLPDAKRGVTVIASGSTASIVIIFVQLIGEIVSLWIVPAAVWLSPTAALQPTASAAVELVFRQTWGYVLLCAVAAALLSGTIWQLHSALETIVERQEQVHASKTDALHRMSPVRWCLQRRHSTATTVLLFRPIAVLLGVWGLVVLAIHVHSSSLSVPQGCQLSTRPWLQRQPSCVELIAQCDAIESSDALQDPETLLRSVELSSVQHLKITHCSALSIPVTVRGLGSLDAIVVFNATVVSWDAAAALQQEWHRSLLSLLLVRVNFSTNGELPFGLRDTAFPPTVSSISIAYSNLRSLPADVVDAWPRRLDLRLEQTAISTFPPVLTRLDVSYLSLVGNNLTEVPLVALFGRDRSLAALDLSNNSIASLPSTVDVSTIPDSLWGLFLANTDVREVPQWIQDMVRQSDVRPWRLALVLSGSPVCDNITAAAAAAAVNHSTVRIWQQQVQCDPMPQSPLHVVYSGV
ncbi:hypothetical protein PINS_up018795 [Pythium insidiosum]|nr:hypothetical protein PINS_up018795 [Pythium insidiosum]